MKIVGSYIFEAPLGTLWEALFDPEVLAKTLPGCEKLEREGDTFRGEINVKMGPVQGKFQGKVDISNVVRLERYEMVVDGRGPAGFVKASAKLAVRAEGAASSRIDYDSDVQVGGRIASVGQRLLDASSRAIVKQSLDGLHAQVRARGAAAQRAPASAQPMAASAQPGVAASAQPGVAASAEMSSGGPSASESAAAAAAPALRAAKVRDFADSNGAAAEGDADARGAGGPPGGEDIPDSPDASERRREATVIAGGARAPAGISPAAFAMGVAREVTKELLPLRTVLLVVGAIVIAVVVYAFARAG